MRLIIGQELPGEVGVKVLPVNHVQDWVELVCSNCDAARCWDKPANMLDRKHYITRPSPVNCVSLDMTGLGPFQLHLHVWLGQTLLGWQMASRPEDSGVKLPKVLTFFCSGLKGSQIFQSHN